MPQAPDSTYRIQVRPEFPLPATAGVADYLSDLGVSHLYTAPLLAATPGSQHGYDVVDHTRVNPEIGGEDGRRELRAALENGSATRVEVSGKHIYLKVL